MSDSDDESVCTEDMNTILEDAEQFETVEVKGAARKSHVKRVPRLKNEPTVEELDKADGEAEAAVEKAVEPKPKTKKPRTPAQIAATEKMLAAKKKRTETRMDARETLTGQRKAPRKDRPVTKVVKEKVIYMIPDEDNAGEFKPVNVKPMGARELKKAEAAKRLKQQEIELGKKLKATKKGEADKRGAKERSPAQVAATKALLERNKAKREAAKAAKAQEKKQEAVAQAESIKDAVEETVLNVVSKPIEVVKAERAARKRPVITDEQRQAYEFRKKKDLFS